MKHTGLKLLATSAAFAVALVTQARAVTWTFLENGTGVNLGSTSIFVESGFSLEARGYLIAGGTAELWGKNDGAGEMGLGMVNDLGGDHEIDKLHFAQIDSHLSPSGVTNSLMLGSVQGADEKAAVYGSNAWGTLGTLLTTWDSNGNVDLSSWLGTYEFFSVTTIGANANANVLLGSVSATVPDGGMTSVLLGLGLISLAAIRRRR